MIHSRWSLCIYAGPTSQPAPANSRCWAYSQLPRASKTTRLVQKGMRVRYAIDRMMMSDVPRVVEIERLAYPSPWPPSAYRKELQDNRWAHYIVLRDKQISQGNVSVSAADGEKPRRFF